MHFLLESIALGGPSYHFRGWGLVDDLAPPDVADVIIIDWQSLGSGPALRSVAALAQTDTVGAAVLLRIRRLSLYAVALRAGAHSCFDLDLDATEIRRAVNSAALRRVFVPRSLHSSVVSRTLHAVSGPSEPSPRELEVGELITHGLRNGTIARLLGISPKTVSTYRARLCDKLSVSSDVELADRLRQTGLVE